MTSGTPTTALTSRLRLPAGDVAAGRDRCREILLPYLARPSYTGYWRQAGYAAEMAVVDEAHESGNSVRLRAALTDRFIDDVCPCGPAARIRDGLVAWFETGVDVPVLMPSSLDGGHRTALRQILAMFA
jgi:hypothetical protein